jgi:hypothetical protein
MESLAQTVVLLALFSTIAGGLIGAGLGLLISSRFKTSRSISLITGLVAGGLSGFFLLPLIGRLS